MRKSEQQGAMVTSKVSSLTSVGKIQGLCKVRRTVKLEFSTTYLLNDSLPQILKLKFFAKLYAMPLNNMNFSSSEVR